MRETGQGRCGGEPAPFSDFRKLPDPIVFHPMEISLEELDGSDESFVLSQPVLNNYGQMLLPAGATISLKHIIILKTWNINTIHIVGEDEVYLSEDIDFGDDVVKHATRRLKSRLNWLPENEWEQELFDLGIKRACEEIVREKKD